MRAKLRHCVAHCNALFRRWLFRQLIESSSKFIPLRFRVSLRCGHDGLPFAFGDERVRFNRLRHRMTCQYGAPVGSRRCRTTSSAHGIRWNNLLFFFRGQFTTAIVSRGCFAHMRVRFETGSSVGGQRMPGLLVPNRRPKLSVSPELNPLLARGATASETIASRFARNGPLRLEQGTLACKACRTS